MARADRAGQDRGRQADRPAEIPAKGWKDILVRIWRSLTEDNLLLIAAGVTFFLLLAIFPALSAFVALYGLIFDPRAIAGHLALAEGVVPPVALDVIAAQLQALAAEPAGSLTMGFLLTLGLALWSANGGVKSIMEGLNIAYDEAEKRSFLRRNLVALAFTLGAMGLIVVMAVVMAVIPAALALVPLGPLGEVAILVLRWPLLLVVIGVALAALYRWGPSRAQAQWRWVTWGSGIAAVAWVLASVGFALYAEGVADFDRSYGAMAAPIAFLLWLWLSMVVVLIGAEINGEMEHQTMRDTTTGPERPLGQRGAAMADRVGAAADGQAVDRRAAD